MKKPRFLKIGGGMIQKKFVGKKTLVKKIRLQFDPVRSKVQRKAILFQRLGSVSESSRDDPTSGDLFEIEDYTGKSTQKIFMAFVDKFEEKIVGEGEEAWLTDKKVKLRVDDLKVHVMERYSEGMAAFTRLGAQAIRGFSETFLPEKWHYSHTYLRLELRNESSKDHYFVEFDRYNDTVTIRAFSSLNKLLEYRKDPVREGDSQRFKIDFNFKPVFKKLMAGAKGAGKYNLLCNNCKTFALDLGDEIMWRYEERVREYDEELVRKEKVENFKKMSKREGEALGKKWRSVLKNSPTSPNDDHCVSESEGNQPGDRSSAPLEKMSAYREPTIRKE